MTIDPKRVKEIFLEAAELSEEAARAAYLDKACGADTGVRARVEALLRAHDPEGSFLGAPAAVVPDPDPALVGRASQPVPDGLGSPSYPDHDATQALTGTPVPCVEAVQTTDGENDSSHDEALAFLAPPTRPDSLGRIGHYEVLQVLGRGGFGIVFRAFDEMLQRVVALKVMAPQLAATSPARKRFLREARSSAQVRHENVVQVYEVAEQPLPYLAMEFIPGETLQQRLDRVGPLDVSEVLRVGRQIAEGLAAAHAMDLIHRDIKPGNVLLEGGQHKVKITDFGLARTADDASISQSGIIAGTPMYMAPEQALGQTLDQRADLFSLGSVLYQMVAGRPPFRANSAVAVLKRVAEDTPRAIREIIPEAPQWLCDIIAKLHAKDPDDRYQSAREVADVLADCEAQLKANAKLKDYSRIPRSKPRRSGRWKWVAAAAALLLPVIALVVTEFAGVTHLFRGQVATNDETEGWVQLFNGKDLSGWQKHPTKPGFWRVDENGHIVGAGPVDYAFLGTVRDDFENFHLRVEAMVDTPDSDSGVFFRVPVIDPGKGFAEINISGDPARLGEQTGSLLIHEIPGKDAWYPAATGLTKPKEWFLLEIIARGDHVVTKVNGQLALDTEVPTPNRRGHIFLQQAGGQTIVRFRKIEIKELPPAGVPTESGAKDAKQAQEAAAKQLGIPVETVNSIGMKFRLIPPGKFTMGSSKEEIDYWLKRSDNDWINEKLPSEGPQHEVEVTKPFYLGQTEVTVGQFRQFVQATGYQTEAGAWHFGKFDAKKNWLNPGFAQTDDHPVVCVNWNAAVEFCNWLSKKERKNYRLPTEAEWEYSCRAGSKGRWSFGDNEGESLNYARFLSNSQGHTWPVAGLKANAWGLHDMHGNAWEWCQDIYDVNYYKTSPPKDPPGPGAGGERVMRGGAWCFFPGQIRSAFRVRNTPDARCDDDGFRVVLAISTPLPAAEQVEEVRKELMRRNPGFDGKMKHTIEDGIVTEVRIVTDKVTDIAPIRVFDALRVLECGGTHARDWQTGFGQLADLTPLKGMNLGQLTYLDLGFTDVADAGMVYFEDCKKLTYLSLVSTQVSDRGLAHFKDCKHLSVLSLDHTRVTDVGLQYFRDCPRLRELYLAGTQVTDGGFADFSGCASLRILNLGGTQVSDAGLADFKDSKNLSRLYLEGTKVGDAGLANLKGVPLRMLSAFNTGITDLTPLQGMPLEEIRLTPKNITRGLDILRDMKSLKTIGIAWDQSWPAAEFWQRYDEGEFK